MAQRRFKCYNCGGEVIVGENARTGICSCCMEEIPLPEETVNVDALYSEANQLLSEKQFDRALEAYREILIRNPRESAACWGIALSQYGIEYVEDPGTARMLPTLHRLSNQKFSDFLYTRQASEYAGSPEMSAYFAAQAELIDHIQYESLQISHKEDPYDVFICYKKTESGEQRTVDSRIARDVYKKLIARGYKVFFAEETLTVGQEFEPRIFAALNSARVLIAIGTSLEYYNAVWVRNEWSRYAGILASEGQSSTRYLIPMFQNMTAQQLPQELARQPIRIAVDEVHNPIGILLDKISDIFGGQYVQQEADHVSAIRRQARTAEQTAASEGESLLQRGNIMLVNGDFGQARKLFNRSLDEKETVAGWLGVLMCEHQICGMERLYDYAKDLSKDPNFRSAYGAADAEEKETLETLKQNWQQAIQRKEHLENMRWECKSAILREADRLAAGTSDAPQLRAYMEERERWSLISLHADNYRAAKRSRRIAGIYLIFFILGPMLLGAPVFLYDTLHLSWAKWFYGHVTPFAILLAFGGGLWAAIALDDGFWKGLAVTLGITLGISMLINWAPYLLLLGIPIFLWKEEIPYRKCRKLKMQDPPDGETFDKISTHWTMLDHSFGTLAAKAAEPYRSYFTEEELYAIIKSAKDSQRYQRTYNDFVQNMDPLNV